MGTKKQAMTRAKGPLSPMRRGRELPSNRFSSRDVSEKNGISASLKSILTFKEVVNHAIANRSRKDISRLMHDIVQASHGTTAHNFLKWQDPKNGVKNTLPISKTASVCIDTSNFKQARAVLNRKKGFKDDDENGKRVSQETALSSK